MTLSHDGTHSRRYRRMFEIDDRLHSLGVDIWLESMDYEPDDFALSPALVEAIRYILDHKKMRYSDFQGIATLRSAVMAYEKVLAGADISTGLCLFFGSGTAELIVAAIKAVFDLPSNAKRRRVVLFAPEYPLFGAAVELVGGICVVVQTRAEDGFVPAQEAIREELRKGASIVLFSNPNNPTGIIYPAQWLSEIVKDAAEVEAFVFSDEAGAELTRPGFVHTPITRIIPSMSNCVRFFGPTKDRPGMTGLRVGYVLGDSRLITGLRNQLLVNRFSLSVLAQHAFAIDLWARVFYKTGSRNTLLSRISEESLSIHVSEVQRLNHELNGRCEVLAGECARTPGISLPVKPQGGNTAWIRFDAFSRDDLFLRKAERAGVGVYPGRVFSAPKGEVWARLCLTRPPSHIVEGLRMLLKN